MFCHSFAVQIIFFLDTTISRTLLRWFMSNTKDNGAARKTETTTNAENPEPPVLYWRIATEDGYSFIPAEVKSELIDHRWMEVWDAPGTWIEEEEA